MKANITDILGVIDQKLGETALDFINKTGIDIETTTINNTTKSIDIRGSINDVYVSVTLSTISPIVGKGKTRRDMNREEMDKEILSLYKQGLTQIEIANQLAVSQSTVSMRLKFYELKEN